MIDLAVIHPILLYIFADFNLYCLRKNIPVTVTNIVNERFIDPKTGKYISVSTTHEEGRAIDVSVKGFESKKQILETVEHFNKKYKSSGAISFSDNQPRVFVYHDAGLGEHIHIQIRRLEK